MAGSIAYWLIVGFVLCGFSFVLIWKLRASGYPRLIAFALVMAALVQPAYLHADALRIVLFSVVSFAVIWGAVALARNQEPRRIVLLGSSLAGAQFLYPLCGAAATLVLPFALRRAFATTGIRHGRGLYISLLFLPILAVSYRILTHPDLSILTIAVSKLSGSPPGIVLAPLAAAVPVTCASARLPSAVFPLVLAVIVTVAGVGALSVLLDLERPDAAVSALAVLSVFVVSCWPDGPARSRTAALLIAANLILSLTVAFCMAEIHA